MPECGRVWTPGPNRPDNDEAGASVPCSTGPPAGFSVQTGFPCTAWVFQYLSTIRFRREAIVNG
ncbi:hypothetical protein GCM10010252_68500 [Streptomyces aureoverticillatus]|nr:hypothetical protein GCM10010252_68500 [Streptomyces aureoverticillatus]